LWLEHTGPGPDHFSRLIEDPATGKVAPEKVQALIDDGIKPLMQVVLSEGTRLQVTTNHLFSRDRGPGTPTLGWVSAGDLGLGDRLRTASGHDLVITNLRDQVGTAHVYTLTIATDHTFFVGPDGVLVHNDDCPGFNPPRGGLRKLSPGQIGALKKAGYNVHEETGTGSVSRFDLYQDQDGWIYQLLKHGKEEPEPLGLNIKDIMGRR